MLVYDHDRLERLGMPEAVLCSSKTPHGEPLRRGLAVNAHTQLAVLPVRRITHELLRGVAGRHRAIVSPTAPGIVAAMAHVVPDSINEPVGTWTHLHRDGDRVAAGEPLVEIEGTALEIMVASDHVMGGLGFAGGIATRALEIRAAAPPGLTIVCGGWKKLPVAMKPLLRSALDVAGVGHRLVDGPFVYVDKNAVRLAGGIEGAASAGRRLDHGPVGLQVDSAAEAVRAVGAGTGIVMIDSGELSDLRETDAALREKGWRDRVLLAFGGGVRGEDLQHIAQAGGQIADVGRAVLDAPLWDLHLEVV
jgi:nicotinate-nucleotide pyrophosphorylase (carboxylating)